jgi:tRNA1Val (adenine37-N6)-methyltransferase
MANSYFKFKQFTIDQEISAMKVGTDGVLLGAWADCNQAKTILDIGTGTGLIALMLAQRSNALIDAVEINTPAAKEARSNFNNSKWYKRLNIFNDTFQHFALTQTAQYDLIVSNPPYFTQSKKAQNAERTLARHNDELSIVDLLTGANNLLSQQGLLCFIIPADNYEEYLSQALLNKLFCSKKLWIKPTPEIQEKRVLLEFSHLKSECEEQTLIIEQYGRHKYSEEYKHLTKDFYLAF